MKSLTKILLVVYAITFICSAQAQNDDADVRALTGVASPKGNYVYFFTEKELFTDTALLFSTKHFVVEKAVYDAAKAEKDGDLKYKTIGKFAPAANLAQVKSFISEKDAADMVKFLRLKSENDLPAYFQQKQQPKDYFLLYGFIEVKQAMGHVFLDTDVKPGEVVVYRIERVSKDNKSENWGTCMVHSGTGNYLLKYLKPQAMMADVADSTVQFNWLLDARQSEYRKYKAPKSKVAGDDNDAFTQVPYPIRSLKARAYLLKDGKWTEAQSIFPRESNDTLYFSMLHDCLPGQQLAAYLVMEDEAHNIGGNSDTLLVHAVTRKTSFVLKSISTSEEKGFIKISWEPIPAEAYISGVELTRVNQAGKRDTLGVFSRTDVEFKDFDVVPGANYTYEGKVVYSPEANLYQEYPAQASATYSKFEAPLPPENVQISDSSGILKITWNESTDPAIYGFYIYRGTSPDGLHLLSGPVMQNYYIDSSKSLSGKSTYYYGIIAQNLTQDTSVFSELVSASPNKPVDVIAPAEVSLFYANGAIVINWTDVRENDNSVVSFILERKENTGVWQVLHTEALTENSYKDSLVSEGKTYAYRIASVSTKGNRSDYSTEEQYFVESPSAGNVNTFYVRNITEGLQIDLPKMSDPDRKGFVIYRRKAAEGQFTKLTELKSDEFSYLDTNTTKGEVYVYAIAVIGKDGTEGAPGISVNARRQ